MNDILKYTAKDNEVYEFKIKDLDLGIKPLWNKILHCIKKEMKFFCSDEGLKNTRAIEITIAELTMQKERAELNCRNAEIPDRTEADEKKLQDLIKIHDEIDIKLSEAIDEKKINPIYANEMNTYVSGIISSIENALLNEENVKIYESTVNLLEGDLTKLDLTDINCFNNVIRPTVVAFFLKNLNN